MRRLAWLVSVGGFVLLVGGALSAPPAKAGFAGTNGRIAFTSFQTGDLQIYAIQADGSGLRELTHSSNPHVTSFLPDWSPKGRRIAFDSQISRTTPRSG